MKQVGNITVFPIGSGDQRRWRASLTIGHGPKGPRRVSRHGRTKQEAQDKIYKLKVDFERNQLSPGRSPTFHDFTQQWLFGEKKNSVTPGTLAGYEYIYTRYIGPHLGGLKVDQIQSHDIQNLMRRLFDLGISKKTINGVRGEIKRILDSAVIHEVIYKNPADKVPSMRRTKEDKTLVKEPLTEIEAAAHLEASIGTEFDLFVHLITILGFRRGEALGLRWSDVDLESGVIEINGAVSEQASVASDGKRKVRKIRTAPKTEAGNRRLALSAPITAALLRQRERAEVFRQLNGGMDLPEYLIFDSRGGAMNPSNYAARFTRWREEVGLRHIRIHDYRHTCATIAFNSGVDAVSVQVGLGHSRLETTKNVYAKAIDRRGIAFGETMGALFTNENNEFDLHLISPDIERGAEETS